MHESATNQALACLCQIARLDREWDAQESKVAFEFKSRMEYIEKLIRGAEGVERPYEQPKGVSTVVDDSLWQQKEKQSLLVSYECAWHDC
jgi:hypothetical protein